MARKPRWRTAGLLAAVVATGLAATAAPVWAAPPRDPVATQRSNDFLGDGHGARDVDNRTGTVAPRPYRLSNAPATTSRSTTGRDTRARCQKSASVA